MIYRVNGRFLSGSGLTKTYTANELARKEAMERLAQTPAGRQKAAQEKLERELDSPPPKPLGVFAVEIGFDQGAQVKELFEAAGFTDVKIIKDLGERDRVVTNGPDPRTNPIPQD
jgi:methylase of polypeptide subunit release factors